MNNTLHNIKERRTTRKFKEEQVKKETLEAIIEAGLYAPSAHNQQSWHFTVVQDANLIEDLNVATKEACLSVPDEAIQKMAANEGFNIFYKAPTVVIVSGNDSSIMPQVDCAAATQNMFIAAESLEVGGCWNGFVGILFSGERRDEYIKKLQIPEGHTPYYAAVFGYPDYKASSAPERKANTVTYL